MRMLGQSSNCTILIRNKKLKDNKSVYEYKVPFINNFYHTIRRDMGTFKNTKNSENSMVFDILTSTEKLTDKS